MNKTPRPSKGAAAVEAAVAAIPPPVNPCRLQIAADCPKNGWWRINYPEARSLETVPVCGRCVGEAVRPLIKSEGGDR